MTEEDEIDVLGDYSLDGFLTGNNEMSNMNSELDILQCDYAMNSQWLLDSSSSCFYNDEAARNTERINSVSPPTVINVVATRPNVSKIEPILGWSQTEMVLLERGLELFGSSAVCLSQFIGSKTPNQVKQYLKMSQSKNNLLNAASSGVYLDGNIADHVALNSNKDKQKSDLDNVNDRKIGVIGDVVLDDVDIPASVEEVISMVSTAKPTIKKSNNMSQPNRARIKNPPYSKERISNKINQNTSRSVLKPAFRKNLSKMNDNSFKSSKMSIKEGIIANMKQRLSKTKTTKRRTINTLNKTSKLRSIMINRNKPKIDRKSFGLQLITGGGKALPISETEEVIKLENKSGLDSDSDVDIEVDDQPSISNKIVNNVTLKDITDNNVTSDKLCGLNIETTTEIIHFEDGNLVDDATGISCVREEVVTTDEGHVEKSENEVVEEDNLRNIVDDYNDKEITDSIESNGNWSAELRSQLCSLDCPTIEKIIDDDNISELEKYFNSEFFDGRPTKTPERYLKIRSHMISRWIISKPHYLSKTHARQGLKNCGDVNSIGRIHSVLEQIGAINFNCEQTNYIRPLSELFKISSVISNGSGITKDETIPSLPSSRPRKKIKSYLSECEGYTISHSEDIVRLDLKSHSLRTHYRRNGGQLLKCMKFTDIFKQPFKVYIELSALICMNLHAITSRNEIMGLVGGKYLRNPEDDSKILHIRKYQPCKTVQQTRIHCEMCPVSQSESVNAITEDGLSVVGWVHSHPGFPPMPSIQDLHTQKEMQSCFQRNGPFVGLIIGPQNSELRCLTIPNTSNDVPYEFSTECKYNKNSIQNLHKGLENLLEIVKSCSSEVLNPNDKSPYNTSVRGIDKMISETKLIFSELVPRLSDIEENKMINLVLDTTNEIDKYLSPL